MRQRLEGIVPSRGAGVSLVPSQGTTPGSRSQHEIHGAWSGGPGRPHWPVLGTDRFPEETTVSKEAAEEGAACPVLVLPPPWRGGQEDALSVSVRLSIPDRQATPAFQAELGATVHHACHPPLFPGGAPCPALGEANGDADLRLGRRRPARPAPSWLSRRRSLFPGPPPTPACSVPSPSCLFTPLCCEQPRRSASLQQCLWTEPGRGLAPGATPSRGFRPLCLLEPGQPVDGLPPPPGQEGR